MSIKHIKNFSPSCTITNVLHKWKDLSFLISPPVNTDLFFKYFSDFGVGFFDC